MGRKLNLRMSVCVRLIAAMRITPGTSIPAATSTTTTRGTRIASPRLSSIEHYGWHIVSVVSKTLDKELKSLPKGKTILL
nr:MAG TPA: hypothetical protein [Caudoviricetes sp.]